MENVIFVNVLFALGYLMFRTVAMYLWDHDKGAMLYIRVWYHWAEYIYVFSIPAFTPDHNREQGEVALIAVILLKIIIDKTKPFKKYLDRKFG